MDVPGVTDAERFVALQDRTTGEAYKMVSNYIYLTDKSQALKDALEELKFFYGKRQGKAESYLAKILEGKEVPTNSVDGIKGLIQEIQEMSAFARATKDASFLELKATVVSIAKKRLSYKVKEKFSKVSRTTEEKGEKVNVDFLIKFLKDWFKDISCSFGMCELVESKPASSSSPLSSPSFKAAAKPSPPLSKPTPFSKANVAAFDATGLGNSQRRSQQSRFSPQQSRSSSQQQELPLVPSSIQWPQQTQQKYKVCIMCSDAHLLDECPRFSELTLQERKQFLFKQRLCLKCFGRNHLIGNCREKVQCLLCSRFGHNTLMHAAPLTSQTSSSSPSSSSGVVNVAPAGPSLGVQNRLLQLSGTQVEPAPTGGNPQENQVNISAVVSNVDCFRPIYAMQVSLPNGVSTAAYGLYDTGSNKTLISRKF